MPFTFAHPAIVLPLSRSRWFSFTALVCGSMAPDFEYFLRMKPFSLYSHTLAGVFYVDLPLAWLMAVLFHHIVKQPMYACLPLYLQKGMYPAIAVPWKLDTWRKQIVFAYSAIFGSLTHLFWDSFTHKGAYFVEKFPSLQESVTMFGMELPVYKLLQHGSTCLGLAAIGFVLMRAVLRSGSEGCAVQAQLPWMHKCVYWLGIGAVGVAFACVHSLVARGVAPWVSPLQNVVPLLSGILVGIVALSLLFGQPWSKKLGRFT